MYSVYTLSLIRINPITTQWKPQPKHHSNKGDLKTLESINKKSAPKLDTLFHFPTLINMN
ncbi:hypothetical protein D778_02645 [Xanthomarina gelatinilytica]|uniref:Uncharacterized protein n=1 Tax=Xanthomarina gelatinilytica TaxID=1137281 RepID=M7NA54_9FLAO|nr:hypothetical protein D778_02645 [Xanthomarina gelatinilytica]